MFSCPDISLSHLCHFNACSKKRYKLVKFYPQKFICKVLGDHDDKQTNKQTNKQTTKNKRFEAST